MKRKFKKVYPKMEKKRETKKSLPPYMRISLKDAERLCELAGIRMYKNTDNYILATNICIWCEVRLYIGSAYRFVDEKRDARFIEVKDWPKYISLSNTIKL